MLKSYLNKQMTPVDIRNWLGLYVLVLSGAVGGYLLLAPDFLLSLEDSDRIASFEIILPFLLGQVAVVYQFYSAQSENENIPLAEMPAWVVKVPPIIVSVLLAILLFQSATAGLFNSDPPSAEGFRALLTFCVAILNVSTVTMIVKYFKSKKSD